VLSRITALLALVFAAGLIAAGCGDDDDETTTAATTTPTTTAGATGATGATGAGTGEPLSKEEFISEGDKICGTANEELEQNSPPEEVADNIQGQIDGLRALTPPEGDEEEITKILDDAQEAVDGVKETGSFQESGQQLEQAGQALQDYGFKECGT
jgi:hypothetical protein